MKKILTLTFAVLFIHSAKAQINNHSFANWDTTYQSSNHFELTSLYDVKNPKGGKPSFWKSEYSGMYHGIAQTTDAVTGDYALVLHTWYHHVVGLLQYHDTLTQTPAFLNGYYKYEGHLQGGTWSHAYGRVALLENGDTVAFGEFEFQPIGKYTPFEIELNYRSSATPDSVHIMFLSSNTHCGSDPVCDLLYLDNLFFSDQSVISTGEEKGIEILVRPNPAQDWLEIESPLNNGTYILTDATGKKLLQTRGENRLFVGNLPAGLYFLEIAHPNLQLPITKKVVIAR